MLPGATSRQKTSIRSSIQLSAPQHTCWRSTHLQAGDDHHVGKRAAEPGSGGVRQLAQPRQRGVPRVQVAAWLDVAWSVRCRMWLQSLDRQAAVEGWRRQQHVCSFRGHLAGSSCSRPAASPDGQLLDRHSRTAQAEERVAQRHALLNALRRQNGDGGGRRRRWRRRLDGRLAVAIASHSVSFSSGSAQPA